MRLAACLLIISLSFTSVAAFAGSGSGHSFGSTTCAQTVPCPNSSLTPSPASLAATANACVTQQFGYSNPSGFFSDYMGLDGNNCLTTNANSIPKGMGAQLSPQCCVTKRSDGLCSFHCDLLSN